MTKPTWTRVRSLGNSSIAKYTILIIPAGYLIIFNASIELWLKTIFDKGMAIDSTLFNLSLFYFGSISVAVGSIIYHFRCPELVKDYGSDRDYIMTERLHTSDLQIREKYDDLIRKGYRPDFAEMEDRQGHSFSWKKDDQPEYDNLFIRIMELNYFDQDIKNPRSILISQALFYFGFALLAIPSLRLFYNVVVSLLKLFF